MSIIILKKTNKFSIYKPFTERACRYLKEKGIYTLAGWENEFSGLDDQFIRFTIGEEWEMDKAVEVLSDYVKRS